MRCLVRFSVRVFFFLSIRRPPRSPPTAPLFPYSPLFRSVGDVALVEGAAEVGSDLLALAAGTVYYRHAGAAAGERLGRGPPHAGRAADDDGQLALEDRKSTRLNSSH